MENRSLPRVKQFEFPYECEKYKRKSSLTRHFLINHEPIELLKSKLRN